MIEHSPVTFLLAALTVFVSLKGFKDPRFTARYRFDIGRVLVNKEYIRLFSSGFLHTGWMHLIFNMLALLAFGSLLEPVTGSGLFIVLYFLSLLGGKLLALLLHKNIGEFTSVGASGAVNGIVYASIALFPYMGIGLFFLPLSIPAWAFGLAYILFTLYGIKTQWGNTAHAVHLGGALIGLLAAVVLYPSVAAENFLPILAIGLPTVAFILMAVLRPALLLTNFFSGRSQPRGNIDHEYNRRKVQEQADLDSILEKIHRKGLKSLTKKEREILEQYSKMRQ